MQLISCPLRLAAGADSAPESAYLVRAVASARLAVLGCTPLYTHSLLRYP
jgi:hypothetical protein